MADPESGLTIIFNGEVYNFRELRDELASRGHRFLSDSDTEVILKGYREWHVGVFRRMRGMFAIAIWDSRRKELCLARDHLGIKPLYVWQADHGIVFGSEVRALLSTGLVPRKLDPYGLISFLKYGSVQEPSTLVDGVMSLPPGSFMLMRAGRGKVRPYWRVKECIGAYTDTHTDVAVRVSDKIEESIRLNMVADVPVGVFLSGGIDSAAIASMAVKAGHEVNTFCVGFESTPLDEREDALQAARLIGTRHTELNLRGEEVRNDLENVLKAYDQPSSDGLNTYFIAKLVRQAGIKVALSGLGGDELFLGYNNFRKSVTVDRWNRILRPFHPIVKRPLGQIAASCLPLGSSAASLLEVLLGEYADPYFAARVVFPIGQIRKMVKPHLMRPTKDTPWFRREVALVNDVQPGCIENRLSLLEVQCYMLSTLLRDADQMSMASGLELRVPLVDPTLVEMVLPLPAELKKGERPKHLLSRSLDQRFPALRRNKRGFDLPMGAWLARELRSSVEPHFMSPGPGGIWQGGVIRNVWLGFLKGTVSWSRVWALLTLETWMRENRISV